MKSTKRTYPSERIAIILMIFRSMKGKTSSKDITISIAVINITDQRSLKLHVFTIMVQSLYLLTNDRCDRHSQIYLICSDPSSLIKVAMSLRDVFDLTLCPIFHGKVARQTLPRQKAIFHLLLKTARISINASQMSCMNIAFSSFRR